MGDRSTRSGGLLPAWLLLLCLLIWAPPRADAADPPRTNVILLLDRSGSMRQNDPQDLSATAARLFLEMLDPADRVALVAFDAGARTLLPLRPLGEGTAARQALTDMGPPVGQWTDIRAALKAAMAQVNAAGEPAAVLLFTDGYPETGPDGLPPGYQQEVEGLTQALADRGVPVFTVGLEQADYTLLSQLSRISGADSFAATSAPQVVKLFAQVLSQIKERDVVLTLEEDLGAGGVGVERTVVVPPYTRLLTLSAVGGSGDVGLAGEDPGGLPLGAAPGLRTAAGANYVVYTIPRPEAGVWRVRLTGAGPVQAHGQLERELRLGKAGAEVGPTIPRFTQIVAIGLGGALAAGAVLGGLGTWNWRRLRRRDEVLSGRLGTLDLRGAGREAALGPGPTLLRGALTKPLAHLEARLTATLPTPLAGLGLGRRHLQLHLRPAPGTRIQINGRPPGDGRLYHGDLVLLGSESYGYLNPPLARRPAPRATPRRIPARSPLHR